MRMELCAPPSVPGARSRSPSPSRPGSPTASEPSLPLPQAYTLMSSFNSFLTVAIHNILYYRGIYPQRTFMSVRAFNLPVHQNRHPAVCSWVHDAVDAAIAQIADGAAQRIGIVIHAPPVKPLPAKTRTDKAAAAPANTTTTPGQKSGTKPPPGTMGPPPLPAKRAIAISTGKVSRPATQPSPATTRAAQTTISATSPATTKTTPGADKDSSRLAKPPPPKPGAVLERWMFDVSEFPAWPGGAEALLNFGVDDPKKKPDKKKKGDAKEGDGDGGRSAEGADGGDGEEDDEDEDSESGEEAAEFTDSDEEQENDEEGDQEQRPASDRELELAAVAPEDEINWVDVNEHLRGAVKRLANTGEQLARLPEGCTFTIAVELRDNARPPLKHPQAWIPTQSKSQPPAKKRLKHSQDVGAARTTAVRSVEAGPLFFECWVEESKAKLLESTQNLVSKSKSP
ncbi:hypothetical protein MCOR27_010472 [Pyricularia oryzae]|uniref:HORMA domain-containing protein n=1 Tax=Pyricularia grisea TaxID=148305 RepID=A0ABQ8N9U5_PYRGI|nr:hypothetical protein MCOR01_008337 [Pyricularia oryzae]KAI6292311.1 hypothetical protein MCOR33_009963 [Pyricularia grisea]KAH9438947.1 hypothetical protein MCOR02_002536 [Pyricularia oryzae]KAI6253247.1 hypothetical protein MCOR19_010183 [Pyricularia oryzae]KAI6267713.1 hypothetical protein MCOR27_010472 [Pyricularia oryzae]